MTYMSKLSYPTYGVLAWYAMSGDAGCSLSGLTAALDNADLRVKLSKRPTLLKAFKQICREGVSIYVDGLWPKIKGTPERYTNEDGNSGWSIEVDSDGIGNFGGRIVLYDGYETLDLEDIVGTWSTWADYENLWDRFLFDVEDYRDTVESSLLRQLIPRHFLTELEGIRLKSGLFFFESDKCEHLEKLADVLNNQIAPGVMHILPLVKDDVQKKMLISNLDKVLDEQCKVLAEAQNDITDNDNPTMKKVNKLKSEHEATASLVAKANRILDAKVYFYDEWSLKVKNILEGL